MIARQPKELTGIMVALITPYTDDGSAIDEARLESHIEYLISAGVHGFVPGGSTGEFTALSTAERKQLIELVVKYTKGRATITAGVGALNTKDTVELAIHAANAGADALMVVPPFYDPLTYAQLLEYFTTITTASGLPVMYYNIPGASGHKLTTQELAGLSAAGVRYMKDTSGDAPALTDLLFSHKDDITCFNGWDTLTFYGLVAGAKGSVWGASNFIPELSVELWDAIAVNHDLKKGREIWAKIFPICKFLEATQYCGAVKSGCELRGTRTGGVRKPFAMLDEAQTAELKALLESAGVKTV